MTDTPIEGRRVFVRRAVGTSHDMNANTLIAMAGSMTMVAAALTGAVWDSQLATAPARMRGYRRSQGRHAMPREYGV